VLAANGGFVAFWLFVFLLFGFWLLAFGFWRVACGAVMSGSQQSAVSQREDAPWTQVRLQQCAAPSSAA
jgi:hypothetical protein